MISASPEGGGGGRGGVTGIESYLTNERLPQKVVVCGHCPVTLSVTSY